MKTIFCLIIFVILSCKENLVKKSDNSEKNIPEKNISQEVIPEKVIEKVTEIPDEIQKVTSFTISCGSGCAMIYYEKSITSNEVTFRVETYINEVLSEENLEIYVIECDQNKSPMKRLIPRTS